MLFHESKAFVFSAIFLLSIDIILSKSWDVAVTIGPEVHFFSDNGTLLRRIKNRDSMVFSAIAFDQISHTLFLGDSSNQAVKIFSKNLQSKDPEMNILFNGKSDTSTVMDMAYDQSSQCLFWTDSRKQVIYKMNINSLNGSDSPKIILRLKNENPHGLSLDICHQRLYWANSNQSYPSISSANLDGTNYSIIINKDLYQPVAVTVDHLSQQLYWIDDEEGINFKIERSNLDGTRRELLIRGNHQQPFNIAIDYSRIYWSDWVYKAVWSIEKNTQSVKVPKTWKSFRDNNKNAYPTSIITYNNIAEIECITLQSETLSNYSLSNDNNEKYSISFESNQVLNQPINKNSQICLNGGHLNNISNTCQCDLGYSGPFCEKSVCDGFCVYGECNILYDGKPNCQCHSTHQGLRCEQEICLNYCLNEGECRIENNEPICLCKYSRGIRCEELHNVTQICRIICASPLYSAYEEMNDGLCRCSEINSTSDLNDRFIDDSWTRILTVVLIVIIGILLILIVILSYFLNKFRCRPLIKKRFVMSRKGITPLTSRPQLSSDQCEIMIEDCCNMNICETPCFEPKIKNPDLKGTKMKGKFHC
ncbi:protein cueball [Microplitis mediator]|uniref:protein cueball n=1 Tax=Microplitis mediator TaxID=375433 RepID=UPI0025554A40|nr:protein cueball [Microplitis mediator]